MKVLFGSNYKGPGQTGEFAYLALKRMGCDVTAFTPSQNPPEGWMKVAPNADALEILQAAGGDADLFFMVESSVGSPFLPKRIPDLPIPSAYWLYDNYLNFRWNKEMAALFDYCFFAQRNRIDLARKYGASNLHWLPFAADEVFHKNFNVKRDINIGYVGSITEQKEKYFSSFAKSGLSVVTNDRRLSHEDIGKFYSRCKLVYNILARRDMNVRTFEASAAGALVVNQRWIDEGCFQIFKEGESMMFHDFDDAPEICRKLLADDAGRERMAANAERIVMSAHTYRHRMQTVFDVCAGGVTEERMRRRSSFSIPVAEALVCSHRDFNWKARARENLAEAAKRSFLGTAKHLFKYFLYRIKEKTEKIMWSFGKAPI